MPNREKLLAIGFGTVVLLWLVAGTVSSWVLGPFRTRTERVENLTGQLEKLSDQSLEIARAQKQMRDWKAASLPPDRGAATAKRPDALDAQRLYQEWLTDLVHLSGFDTASIKPAAQRRFGTSGRGNTAKTVYVGVVVTIETEGRFSQLCTFLDHFYRANLLQRINKLSVDSRESEGDPVLKIALEAEGLALTDVPWRAKLFPETALTANVDDKTTSLPVNSSEGFPKKAPFRIRVGNEYAQVTALNGNVWTLTRGVDRTYAAAHTSGALVELAPVNPSVPERSVEDFRQLLSANIFIKPPPPKEYRLKVGPLADQSFARGDSLSFTLPISDYDPTLGKPELEVTSTLPMGMQLDRGTGKLNWTPTADQAIGTFPVEIQIRHPSAEKGTDVAKFNVILREKNVPPTAPAPEPQVAFLEQPWTFPLAFTDPETPAEKLSIKLENSPEGATYDPATRSLKWTPPATLAPGPQTITVVATDDGLPPQSKSLAIPVTVEEDAARFTFLVGAISIDGAWQAWLHNRAQNKRTVVRVGDQVSISKIGGKVVEIGKDFVILEEGDQLHRLELGQNLRELATAKAEAAPART